MPPKRPADNNKESEEKRKRVDESLNMDNRGIQNRYLAPALRSNFLVTSQLRKFLIPKKKRIHGWSKQYFLSVSQSLAGEQNPVPGRLFHSSSLPIDCKVSDKVRAKIWALEFIDFGVLNLLILGSCFQTRFLKTSLKLPFKQLIQH